MPFFTCHVGLLVIYIVMYRNDAKSECFVNKGDNEKFHVCMWTCSDVCVCMCSSVWIIKKICKKKIINSSEITWPHYLYLVNVRLCEFRRIKFWLFVLQFSSFFFLRWIHENSRQRGFKKSNWDFSSNFCRFFKFFFFFLSSFIKISIKNSNKFTHFC